MIKELENKTIGVFFGGQNPEHDISIITGEFVLAELKHSGYKALGVYVSKSGDWYLGKEIDELKFFKGKYEESLKKLNKYTLDVSRHDGTLSLESKKMFGKKVIEIDLAFPAFHGLGGEDGSVQGLYEFFGVPYAGCGIYTSSLAMNKIYTKKFLEGNNFNTTKYLEVDRTQWAESKDMILEKIESHLDYPIFAKPSRAGSSIGISRAKNKKELKEAIDLALYYDTDIIVENGVENLQDLTCAILSDGRVVTASEVQESKYSDDGFLNYEDKYIEGGGTQTGEAGDKLIIPAEISGGFKTQIQETSKTIFKELNANGTMRVDFLFNKKTEELFVNEFNTLPGTLYHHLWEKSGVDISTVWRRCCNTDCKERVSIRILQKPNFRQMSWMRQTQ